FILVDAEAGKRGPAFGHARLAEALAKATGREVRPTHLPIDRLEIRADGVLLFTALNKTWRFDTDGLKESKEAPAAPRPPASRPSVLRPTGEDRSRERASDRSPDGKWSAFIKDHNVHVRDRATGDE